MGGIGVGSELAWLLDAGLTYRLNERVTLKAGYRAYDIDYDDGSGDGRFVLDGQFAGPTLGVTIVF